MLAPPPVHSTPAIGTEAAAPVSSSGRSSVPSGWGEARAVSRSSAASGIPAVLPQRCHASLAGGGSAAPAPCAPPCGQSQHLLAQALVGHRRQGRSTVLGQPRIQVHDPCDRPGAPVRGTQHRMDAVVVAHQHDLPAVRPHGPVDHPEDVRDVRLQIDVPTVGRVSATEPRQGHRTDLGTRRGQPRGRVVPHVRAGEHTGHQDEHGHGRLLGTSSSGGTR